MTIPKSFDGSSKKPKKMNAAKKTPRKTKIALKYTVKTENHGHRKVALILLMYIMLWALGPIRLLV